MLYYDPEPKSNIKVVQMIFTGKATWQVEELKIDFQMEYLMEYPLSTAEPDLFWSS